MGIIILILIVIGCLLCRRSYFLYVTSFLFMWISFGWNSKNPDIEIYKFRFDAYDGWLENVTEPLYTWTMKYFHEIGITFQESYIIISLLFLCSLFFYISMTTKNRNMVIALVLISTYCMLITLFRTTFATTFALVGLYVLIYGKNNKILRAFLFCGCMLMAACFHSLYFIYLLFVVILWVPRKLLVRSVGIGILLASLFVGAIASSLLPDFMGLINMGDKANLFLGDTEKGEGHKAIQFILAALRVFSVVVVPFAIRYLDKRIQLSESEETILNLNIMSLFVVPLLYVSHDLYRVFYAISIVNFCMIANYVRKNKIFWFSILASLNVGYWFYIRPYFEETFVTIFTNNLFFN